MVQVIKEQAICLDEFGELLISKDSVHMLIFKESDTTMEQESTDVYTKLCK